MLVEIGHSVYWFTYDIGISGACDELFAVLLALRGQTLQESALDIIDLLLRNCGHFSVDSIRSDQI